MDWRDNDETEGQIERWINDLITHRSQIINIYAKAGEINIEEYIVTYWEIYVPEDWDSEYEE